MITATYNPETGRVRMECGIGETRCVQYIDHAAYIVRMMNWPTIYPPVLSISNPSPLA